ncbi:MAG: gas vesicle protein GvpJ [Actinomycetes bacterium]
MTDRAVTRDRGGGYLSRPAPSGLADVIEIVLGKGIVIDAYLRVSLLGIELLTVDARVVVASVDTYLRFAESTNRLDLEAQGPPSLVDVAIEGAGKAIESVAADVVEGKVEDVVEKVEDTVEKAKGVAKDVAQSVAGTVVEKTREVVEKLTPDDDGEDDTGS